MSALAVPEGLTQLMSKFSKTALRYAGLYEKTLFNTKGGPFKVPMLKPSQFESLKSTALKEGISESDFNSVVRLPEVLPINKYIPLLVRTKPHFFNGKWYSPSVGGLQLSKLRDQALKEGISREEFPVQPKEKTVMKTLGRPPKGHKREVRKVERETRIKELMAKMPQMIADYKKEKREQKLAKEKKSPIEDVLQFKKAAEREEKREKRAQKSAAMKNRKRK